MRDLIPCYPKVATLRGGKSWPKSTPRRKNSQDFVNRPTSWTVHASKKAMYPRGRRPKEASGLLHVDMSPLVD